MMPNRLSHHAYTNNISWDAKSIHNILKAFVYIENIIREYFNLLSLHQYISKNTILRGGWSTQAHWAKTRGATGVSRRILEYLSVICAKRNFKSSLTLI